MQEEISERTIALGEKGTKFTADMLLRMMRSYLEFMKRTIENAAQKSKEEVIPHGKMTIEELVKQNKGATAMVIDDIKDWDEIAAKYGVDYAAVQAPVLDQEGNKIMKDGQPLMQYNVYFKAQDTEVITEAFKQYVTYEQRKAERLAARAKEKTDKRAQKVQKKAEKAQQKAQKKEQKMTKRRNHTNVKEMVKKNKERAAKHNRTLKEKNRSRGDRSL